MDLHRRSIVKGLTWRALALLITARVLSVVTGRAQFALAIGVVDLLIKIAAYYLHEGAWNRVRFGLSMPTECRV